MERLRRWAKSLKLEVLTLYLALRRPGVPLLAKLVAGLVVAYAFSPIDLIPDFIPVLGLLDDLLLVPLGVMLALKLMPRPLLEAARLEAQTLSEKPVSRRGTFFIIFVWSLLALTLGLWLWRRFSPPPGL